MATAQLQRSSVATDSWSAVLPNPTISKQKSEQFVKKLVALGVSNLLYIRAIFPESAYVDRELEGIRLKILRDSGTSPAVSQVISWLKGAFEAFTNNYLRQLIVAIHVDGANVDDAIETYTFSFTYKGKDLSGCSVSRKSNFSSESSAISEMGNSLKDIRLKTMEMLRVTVQLTQSLPVLPEKCGISMKLLYYDEVTPSDYEPPGFHFVKKSSFFLPSESCNVKLGEVTTPFHILKLNSKIEYSKLKQVEEDKTAMNETQNTDPKRLQISDSQDESQPIEAQTTQRPPTAAQVTPISPQADEELLQAEAEQDGADSIVTDFIPPSQPGPALAITPIRRNQIAENRVTVAIGSPAQPGSSLCTTNTSEICTTPSGVRKAGVRCACGIEKDGGLMVQCYVCNKWQHGNCYGLRYQTDQVGPHVCEECHIPGNIQSQCTDTRLLSLSISERQEVCLYRRTLMFIEKCLVTPQLIAHELVVSADIAQLLFTQLDKDGVLKAARGKGVPRSVNMRVLKKEVMPRYFGPTADLKTHQFSFRPTEPADSAAEDLEKVKLTSNTAERSRQKRMRVNKVQYVIEDDEKPSRKRQKTSQTARVSK